MKQVIIRHGHCNWKGRYRCRWMTTGGVQHSDHITTKKWFTVLDGPSSHSEGKFLICLYGFQYFYMFRSSMGVIFDELLDTVPCDIA